MKGLGKPGIREMLFVLLLDPGAEVQATAIAGFMAIARCLQWATR